MSKTLLACAGGVVLLPNRDLVLVPREAGGNLLVNPPREVWERSELSAEELTQWSQLVAATGRAMIDTLPQLAGGCVNYWEAGNWALNERAEPPGVKTAPQFRRVHLHLLGRSRFANHPDFTWGEAPRFPRFSDRLVWASAFERLTAKECRDVVTRTRDSLISRYGFDPAAIPASQTCEQCGYPSVSMRCEECR